MFPVIPNVLKKLDFSKEDITYQNLVKNELDFCNQKYKEINTKAKFIYSRRLKGNDTILNKNCCNFELLEEKLIEYININQKKVSQKKVSSITLSESSQNSGKQNNKF